MLARPLRLRNGNLLAPILGINLAPGPAFVWWQLALGATLTLVGLCSLAAIHGGQISNRGARITIRLTCLLVIVVGLGTIVRAFRTG